MRLALIGYGNIAKKHIEVFKHFGVNIIASCNRSEAGNVAAKEEAGIRKTYTNYIEMAEKEAPDAILVCVTFDKIYEVTKALIPLKIPLLIEKPAGTSVAELLDLIALKNKYETIVQVALNRRHYSIFNTAINDMGGIQNLTSMSIEWSENPIRAIEKKNYTESMAAKLIYANSIHGLDTLLHFPGVPVEEQIITKNFDGKFRCQMQLSGLTGSGKLIHFNSSWDNPVPWRIVMTSAGIRYVFAPLETCVKLDSNGTETILEADSFDKQFKAGFYTQAKHFMQIISEKRVHHEHDLDSCISGMVIAEKFYKKLFQDKSTQL